jgi:exosortase K
VKTILATLVAVALTFSLKHMYSHAGAEDLQWVLAPSCWLVSTIGGVELASGYGAGFISHEHRMVVGPACAGVNFLIIAVLALFFSFQSHFVSLRRKLGWLAQCLVIAYVATILSNGLRILIAAHLYSWDIYGGWLTPERLHRIAGTTLYCASLFGLCAVVERWLKPVAARRGVWPYASTKRMIPMACYVGIAVGVPLLNRAYLHDPSRFLEHISIVLVVCAGVVGLMALARVVTDRLCSGVKMGEL